MTRPPVLQGAFSLGASLAMFKGVKNMLHEYVPDNWLGLPYSDHSSTYVIHRVTTAVVETLDLPYTSPKDDLNWTRVLTFIAQEAEELDLRISAAVLLVCVLGPALWLLLTRESSRAVGGQVSQHVATQTEQSPQEPVTFQYYHYDPAERALLQFGKSRSEPILIGYMPMNFEDEDYTSGNLENSNEVTAGCALRKDAKPTSGRLSNDAIQDEKQLGSENSLEKTQTSVRTQLQDANADTKILSPASPAPQEEQSRDRSSVESHPQEKTQCSEPYHRESSSWDNSIVFESLENRLESSGRSSSSLPSFKCTPSERETSRHSLAHIQLQISPRKTSNVGAQLNPEQAYSQPFTY